MFGTYNRWLNTMTGPFTSQNKLTLTFTQNVTAGVVHIYFILYSASFSLISKKSHCSLAMCLMTMCLMKTVESTTKYMVYMIYWLKVSPQVLLRQSWLISFYLQLFSFLLLIRIIGSSLSQLICCMRSTHLLITFILLFNLSSSKTRSTYDVGILLNTTVTCILFH